MCSGEEAVKGKEFNSMTMDVEATGVFCLAGRTQLFPQPNDGTQGGGQTELQQLARTAAGDCLGKMTAATADVATQTDCLSLESVCE